MCRDESPNERFGQRLVRFYAGAREAAGTGEVYVAAATVGELSAALVGKYGDRMGQILTVSSLLSDGESIPGGISPDMPLPGTGPVDLLPPFAGG